jgi:hypothetical protein
MVGATPTAAAAIVNGCCTLMATNPTITPFAIHMGNCPLASSAQACISSKLTILRASVAKFTGTRQTFQSPESPKHTFSHTKGSLQPDGLPLHI